MDIDSNEKTGGESSGHVDGTTIADTTRLLLSPRTGTHGRTVVDDGDTSLPLLARHTVGTEDCTSRVNIVVLVDSVGIV